MGTTVILLFISVTVPVFSGEGYPCKLLPGSADIISLAAVYGDFLIRSLINLVVNITIKLFLYQYGMYCVFFSGIF